MIILFPASYAYKALAEGAQGFVLFPQWPSEAVQLCPLTLSSATS